jgi:predicted TIM-barrel fold metal-dependent hydrolase
MRKWLSVPCFSVFLVLSAAASTSGQTAPAADHHAHLQSATAAQLLNEGARANPDVVQEAPEKPYTAHDLIAAMDAAGIRRATALSEAYLLASKFAHPAREEAAINEENDWTLRQVKQYPLRLVGFCSVNPIRPYALAAIRHCEKIGLRGGLKVHLAASHFQFSNAEEVRQLQDVFREANRLRLPILIHLHPDNETWDGGRDALTFFERVLPLAPDVPVQIAHMAGWGGYDDTADAALSVLVKQCALHAKVCRHLYFDIPAVLVPPSAAQAAPGSDLRILYDRQKRFPEGPQHLAANIRKIGLWRILFATDWPVFDIKDSVQLLRQQLPLAPAEIDEICRNTAPYFPTAD